MSRIDAEFAASLARVWQRFEPEGQDLQTLAAMLAPMDDAGEAFARRMEFEMEPSDFVLGLEAMAREQRRA